MSDSAEERIAVDAESIDWWPHKKFSKSDWIEVLNVIGYIFDQGNEWLAEPFLACFNNSNTGGHHEAHYFRSHWRNNGTVSHNGVG